MFRVLEPTHLGRLDLRNRFMRSATRDVTTDDSGAVTDASVQLHGDLAAGGVGLIVTGNAFVSRYGQGGYRQYSIHSDDMIPGLARLAQVAHQHGAKIAVQINHCGLRSPYQKRLGQVLLAPSLIETDPHPALLDAEFGGLPPHRALTEAEIEGIVDDFAAAAVRVQAAGFDAVQIHAAHSYLLSQLLSPITNRRQDRWGGSVENRYRFPVEVVRRSRAALGPDFPLWMKLGIADDVEGGATLEDGLAALAAMAEAGLDAVEISSGITAGRQTAARVTRRGGAVEEVYYREWAAAAKKAVGIPVAQVGGIRKLETAEDVVTAGHADLISLCRPLIREPGLINRWAAGDIRRATCISCNRCSAICGRGEPLECGEDRRLREKGGATTTRSTSSR